MTVFFLLALALAWLAVFLPAILKARSQTPLSSAQRFRHRMSAMDPTGAPGRWILVPQSAEGRAAAAARKARRHRRRLFVFLLWCVALSGAAALLLGGSMWEVNLAFDASLAIYVALLLEAKKRHGAHATVRDISSGSQRSRRRGAVVELDQAVGHFGGRRG